VSSHPVWDLPTRLFHWMLLLAVCVSWASQELEIFRLHEWSGYTVLVLVAFRLIWGFIGSTHSRFNDFLSGPAGIIRYLRGNWTPRPGHNPLGAWSIVVMLALLLGQAVTGLFNSDELMYDGPLFHALDSSWTDKLGELHDTLFWALLGFVLLHVCSVCYYQFVRKDNLLGPMVHGGEQGSEAPASLRRALLVVVLCCALLATALYFAPEPQPLW
jgi:cytochrome b